MTILATTLLTAVVVEAVAIVALVAYGTRCRRAERLLRASEQRFRLIAEHAPVMIWTARPDTTLDYLNRTCVDFTGMPLERLLDEGWLSSVHPDDRDRCIQTYTPALAARQPFLIEYRLRRADDDYRWVLDSSVPRLGPDGGLSGYIGCCIDISERRAAEQRIHESQAAIEASHREIQHLAGRLIEAQDAERARIARDLHDDISQQLAGLAIAFSGIKQRLTDVEGSAALWEDIHVLQQRTGVLAHDVRHLSHDLHPTVLRHAGLVASLTAYCAETERTHRTRMTCSADGDFATITPSAALCLYRVAQEALRNVVAHAAASEASVTLLRMGDLVELTIEDDGRGFDFEGSSERSKGLGLVSISERVRLAGGSVRIAAAPARGTRVSARIPVTGN